MERQLGGAPHDGAVRRGERRLRVPLLRLQGGPRVHRRLHLPADALQGLESDPRPRALPQADRRLAVGGAPGGLSER